MIRRMIFMFLIVGFSALYAQKKADSNHLLTLQLDLSDYHEQRMAVAVLGSQAPMTWEKDKSHHRLYEENGDGIWEIKLNLSATKNPILSFKFAFGYGEVWSWESLPGFTNHCLALPPTGQEKTFRLKFDNETGRIVSADPAVDNHKQMLKTYPKAAVEAGVGYYQAVYALLAGEAEKALALFNADAVFGPNEFYRDDFHWIWTRLLQVEEKYDEALKIVKERQQLAGAKSNAAFWLYMEGEVLTNSGKTDAAEITLTKARQHPKANRKIIESSFLADGSLQETRSAKDQLAYLNDLAKELESYSDAGRKRMALYRLSEGYRLLGETQKYSAYEQQRLAMTAEFLRQQQELAYLKRLATMKNKSVLKKELQRLYTVYIENEPDMIKSIEDLADRQGIQLNTTQKNGSDQ
jgi:tetratricopeptide (TPR) repeat protein